MTTGNPLSSTEMEKVEDARIWSPGYILGTELTPFLTDEEVLEVITLKDRLAALYNAALERAKWHKNQKESRA